MKVYVVSTRDVGPDACRSSCSGESVELSRHPATTNMSHQPIEHGWAGTTNDIDVVALGVVDTDGINWRQDLLEIIPDNAEPDWDEITAWVTDTDTDEPLEIPLDERQESRSATWDPTDGDEWWPTLRDGWTIVAGDDNQESSWVFGCRDDQRRVAYAADLDNDIDVVAACQFVLDSAGVDYDNICCEDYGAGGYSGWNYICVHDDSREAADVAVSFAINIAEAVIDAGLNADQYARLIRAAVEASNVIASP